MGEVDSKLCVRDVRCLFQNKGNRRCGKVQLVCVCTLLGMGDSLGRAKGGYLRNYIVTLITKLNKFYKQTNKASIARLVGGWVVVV